jgi:hypothetical protein
MSAVVRSFSSRRTSREHNQHQRGDLICFPGAAIAIPAAIGAVQAQRAGSVARDQNRHQRQLSKINQEVINTGAARQLQQLRSRQLEEHQLASQQIQDITNRARSFQAQALTSAGDTGTAGNSLVALTNEFERNQLQAQARLGRRLERQDVQFDKQGEAIRDAQRVGVLNSLPQSFVEPDPLFAGLVGGLSGLGAELGRPNNSTAGQDALSSSAQSFQTQNQGFFGSSNPFPAQSSVQSSLFGSLSVPFGSFQRA